jgi:MFS family permease
MAIAGFGILFYTSGVFFYGFAAFFDAIVRDFGWSKGAASGAFAFQRMEQGIFGPVVGYISDRFGPRRSLLGGLSLLGLGFILLSFIQTLWQFYAAFIVLAFGLSFGSFLTVNTAVNAWFIRKKGRAMAIVSYGPGVSSILVPGVVALIVLLGWREALLVIGVATWVVGIPLALVMRRSPEAYGMLPDGDTAPTDDAVDGDGRSSQRFYDVAFTAREALRTVAYWKYVLAAVFGFVFFSALIIHQITALKSFGLSDGWATALATLMPLASLPGRIVGGVLADIYDKRKVVAVSWGMQLVGALLFVVVSNPIQGLLYAVVFGFGFGLGNPPRTAILGEYFGRRAYGSLLGTQQLVTGLGGIVAPIYAGWMADVMGASGYRIAFFTLAAPALVAIYLYLSMKRPAPPASPLEQEQTPTARTA